MSFYFSDEKMELTLRNILNELADNKRNYILKDCAITWVNYKKNPNNLQKCGCGINSTKQIYPASIVKLIYGLAIHDWISQGKLIYDQEINNATFEMLFNSSNDATSYIVDTLTGTTSGPSLDNDQWTNWKFQRNIINDWLRESNLDELNKLNCCQKTWEDRPYGREFDFYSNNKNRNSLTTDGTARIMEEIMLNRTYPKENINLKNCLFRRLNKHSIKKTSNNQIEGFLGEGIPENTLYWSKAGLMSKVRHDAAWWKYDEFNQTLLVVFGDNEDFVQDELFFPQLAQAIHKLNNVIT